MTAALRTFANLPSVDFREAGLQVVSLFAQLMLATGFVVTLYLVKSAAGINMFAGHSLLHDLLYHFVR